MSYNDHRSLSSSSLSAKEKANIARNLNDIERMRNVYKGNLEKNQREAEERRKADERRKEREQDMRHQQQMNAAMEESQRRINEENRRAEEALLRQKEEYAERERAREAEHSERLQRQQQAMIDNMNEAENERRRKQMAVSYLDYDRYNELYYYYDERGDYIDTQEARKRWQMRNCKSYRTYDPKDDFWEYFLDGRKTVIDRKAARYLWERENCPDYLNYDEEADWNMYRYGDKFISTSEALELWLKEKAGTPEVKAYNIKKQTVKIFETISKGIESPTKILTMDISDFEKSSEIKSINNKKKEIATKVRKLHKYDSNIAESFLKTVLSFALVIYCLSPFLYFVKAFNRGNANVVKVVEKVYNILYNWDTVMFFFLILLVVTAIIIIIERVIKANIKPKIQYYMNEMEDLEKELENYKDLCKEVYVNFLPKCTTIVTLSLVKMFAIGWNIKGTMIQCGALYHLIERFKHKNYVRPLYLYYSQVSIDIHPEIAVDPTFASLTASLYCYEKLRSRHFGDYYKDFHDEPLELAFSQEEIEALSQKGLKMTITYLSSEAADSIVLMLRDMGIRAKKLEKKDVLLKQGPAGI